MEKVPPEALKLLPELRLVTIAALITIIFVFFLLFLKQVGQCARPNIGAAGAKDVTSLEEPVDRRVHQLFACQVESPKGTRHG